MKGKIEKTVEKKSDRKSRHFWKNVFGPYLFLLVFILGLSGWTYWLKPFENTWMAERETGRLRQYFKGLKVPYDNQPWEELFTVEADKVCVLRRKLPLPTSIETAEGQEPEAAPQSAGLPKEALAFGFEHRMEGAGPPRNIFMVLDTDGTVLDVKVYAKGPDGRQRDILDDEPEFIRSLRSQTRNFLFLVEDEGKVMVIKKDPALSRDILDSLRSGIDFYWKNQEAFLTGAEETYAAD